ncbi:hypothetical protein CJU89_4398 [Yarrowia sp. B02]|nr:hypothetical protein CJU89_4398 [Yarrowia sp. B02]
MTTSFYLGYSKKSLSSTTNSLASSVYNSSDEFVDAERAWDPAEHLVSVVTRRAGDPRERAAPSTPVVSRKSSRESLSHASAASSSNRSAPPGHIAMPSNTFMAHGLPTCDDLETVKEFDFGKRQANLPKAPLDFLVERPPSPPYVHVSVPQNSPLSGSGTPSNNLDGVLKTHNPVQLDEMLKSSLEDEEEMAAFLDDEDDYPASNEDEGSDDEKDTFYVDADTIKAAHESVLDLQALLQDNFTLIPGESVESLEKRALRMVHLEESFSVQDSFEPRTLLADQDRAFIPWIPVIEDLHLYFEMRYPEMIKGSSRYEFHRARLIRNRTRLRILAQYVADLEHRSRNLCRLSRSF